MLARAGLRRRQSRQLCAGEEAAGSGSGAAQRGQLGRLLQVVTVAAQGSHRSSAKNGSKTGLSSAHPAQLRGQIRSVAAPRASRAARTKTSVTMRGYRARCRGVAAICSRCAAAKKSSRTWASRASSSDGPRARGETIRSWRGSCVPSSEPGGDLSSSAHAPAPASSATSRARPAARARLHSPKATVPVVKRAFSSTTLRRAGCP